MIGGHIFWLFCRWRPLTGKGRADKTFPGSRECVNRSSKGSYWPPTAILQLTDLPILMHYCSGRREDPFPGQVKMSILSPLKTSCSINHAVTR